MLNPGNMPGTVCNKQNQVENAKAVGRGEVLTVCMKCVQNLILFGTRAPEQLSTGQAQSEIYGLISPPLHISYSYCLTSACHFYMLCVNTFLTHIVCMHVCVIMIIN